MRDYKKEYFQKERDYDKAMSDVIGLRELVGEGNSEINKLDSTISDVLTHIEAFPDLSTISVDGLGYDWVIDSYNKEDIEHWLIELKKILEAV